MLSGGYVRMVDMVSGKNDEFRREATAELERRRLGPFSEGASRPSRLDDPTPESSAGSSGVSGRRWGDLHENVRRGLIYAGLLVAVTIGAGLETFGHAKEVMDIWIDRMIKNLN